LRGNDKVKTIKIDAYVSPQVPAEYAAHRLNFLSTLSELSSLSGGKIVVDVHEIENFSQEATNARRRMASSRTKFARLIVAPGRQMRFTGAAFSRAWIAS